MTLVIDGDLSTAHRTAEGRLYLQGVRRALVTGGRALLAPTPGRPYRHGFVDGFGVRLAPTIEHRIRTSGATLDDDEIRAGMEQLREDDEDVAARIVAEKRAALRQATTYAAEQLEQAIEQADPRALTRCWEMARKAIGLRRTIDTKAATP